MIRGRILVTSLVILAAVAASLGIIQLWFTPMLMETFVKTLATLLIAGVVISFLIAVDYDLPGHRGRILLGILAGLVLAGSFILILQIWWQVFSGALFWKIGVTIIVLSIFLGFIMAMLEDFGSNRKLRDEKYID